MTLPKQKPQRKRHSTLKWMAFLLAVSSILRVGDQYGIAYAEAGEREPQNSVSRADRVLGVPLDDQTLPILLEEFQAREAKLLSDEAEIRQKREALSEAEELVAAQLIQLEEVEARLSATLAKTDSAAADDLARLAVVYENMKPRDTAALFSEMAPGFAAGFLGIMRPDSAAAIMTELEPQTAHLISVMLAGRNASAPRRN